MKVYVLTGTYSYEATNILAIFATEAAAKAAEDEATHSDRSHYDYYGIEEHEVIE